MVESTLNCEWNRWRCWQMEPSRTVSIFIGNKTDCQWFSIFGNPRRWALYNLTGYSSFIRWNSIARFILVLVISIRIGASFECFDYGFFVRFVHANIASLCWYHCHSQGNQHNLSTTKKIEHFDHIVWITICICLKSIPFHSLFSTFFFFYFGITSICTEILHVRRPTDK